MTALHVLGNPNAAAGRRSRSIDEVVSLLRARGHEVTRHDARSRDEAAAAAHDAVAAGASRLVVVGGDGLVHLAVQALACRDVTLGVVPMGTGNDYARALGVAGAVRVGRVDERDAGLEAAFQRFDGLSLIDARIAELLVAFSISPPSGQVPSPSALIWRPERPSRLVGTLLIW